MSNKKLPIHLAIIMDGNGRWSKQYSLPKKAGHKKGADSAKKIVEYCKKIGIKYLTLYTFSSENWYRPEAEVSDLMDLLRNYLKSDIKKLVNEGIKILVIGDKSKLAQDIQDLIVEVEAASKNNDFTLLLAISYGGRDEIQNAATLMCKDAIQNNNTDLKIEDYLYTRNVPYPDLLIRTGGDYRISNFLLWQIAYAELYFTEKLWPDFEHNDIDEAISSYRERIRKFGR